MEAADKNNKDASQIIEISNVAKVKALFLTYPWLDKHFSMRSVNEVSFRLLTAERLLTADACEPEANQRTWKSPFVSWFRRIRRLEPKPFIRVLMFDKDGKYQITLGESNPKEIVGDALSRAGLSNVQYVVVELALPNSTEIIFCAPPEGKDLGTWLKEEGELARQWVQEKITWLGKEKGKKKTKIEVVR